MSIAIPAHVQEWFEQQRKEQQTHNTIAVVKGNVRKTETLMHGVMVKIAERGDLLEEAEEQMEELVDSSADFYMATLPTWKRYLYSWAPPKWWYNWCCDCKEREAKNM